MLKIIYVAHTLTYEQVAGVTSGWSDTKLTDEGVREARHIGTLLKDIPIDAAYSADLRRAYQTAGIVLEYRHIPITQDRRLREVNYGQLTGRPRSEVKLMKSQFIDAPFPDGESYRQVVKRYQAFLAELRLKHQDQTVFMCASGVYPLEVIINGGQLIHVLTDKVATYRTFQLS